MTKTSRATAKFRRGFTLIELVIVLIIVATLAGLILPNVAMLGRSADMAATASSQREIANNIQLYFALQKRFPKGMDSLLLNSDKTQVFQASQDNSQSGNVTGVTRDNQVTGLPVSGAGGVDIDSDLRSFQLSNTTNDKSLRSLTRCGFEYVYDHRYQEPNANQSTSGANTQRPLTGNNVRVATVFQGTPAVTARAARGTPGSPGYVPARPARTAVAASTLFRRLLPDGLPRGGTQVVALGFGGRNSAIGKTVNTAPIYPGNDGFYYGRYIAYFVCYKNGERATLVGVSDCYGRTQDYSIQQFNESLPNGGRQG